MNYTYCFHRICIRMIQSELLVAGRLFEHLKLLILFYEVTWLKWCSKWMISHGKNTMLIWIYCIISLGCINPCLHTIAKPPYFVALFFYSILHKLIHEKVSKTFIHWDVLNAELFTPLGQAHLNVFKCIYFLIKLDITLNGIHRCTLRVVHMTCQKHVYFSSYSENNCIKMKTHKLKATFITMGM